MLSVFNFVPMHLSINIFTGLSLLYRSRYTYVYVYNQGHNALYNKDGYIYVSMVTMVT